jgi:3-hydroxyisobutyrate dehydrogenase-like beta-hydroxyacid dehydrogenase
MKPTIGLIGVGNLGRPIGMNLLAAGFGLRAFNRTPDKVKPLADAGATAAADAPAVAQAGGIVLSILPDDATVERIADERLMKTLGPGGVHVSMSTILPETSRRLAEHHARHGVTYLAAPVFGRPEAAAAKKLWICTSGPADAKARARPIFDAIGQGVYDFGEAPGAANVVKLMGNFIINAAVEAMAEASAVVERNAIPRADFLGMMTQTLFNCPVYQNYARKITAANFNDVGFTLALGLKDVELMMKTAGASRTPLPMGGLVRDRLLSAMAKGREGIDAAAFALGAAEDAALEWFKK